jgi:hypothetical protein
MSLQNSSVIQQCATCPEVIQNVNGALLKVFEAVTIEKE